MLAKGVLGSHWLLLFNLKSYKDLFPSVKSPSGNVISNIFQQQYEGPLRWGWWWWGGVVVKCEQSIETAKVWIRVNLQIDLLRLEQLMAIKVKSMYMHREAMPCEIQERTA